MDKWIKRFNRNKAYILLSFWGYSKKSSHTYLIPIEAWWKFRKYYNKSTLSYEQCEEFFLVYKVKVEKNRWIFEF